MAFGMELSGKFGKVVLSVFRIVAVFGIGWYLYKIAKDEKSSMGLIVCVSMILAGALGNIIDSAFYGLLFDASYGNVAAFLPEGGGYAPFLHGKVVDMFYFPLWKGFYPDWLPWVGGERFIFFRPVFNVADASISVGIMVLLIFQKKFLPHPAVEEA
jgi:signal peptidase II